MVPWLALGVGFQRTVKGGNGGGGDGTTTLNFDWNYEYIYDWTLGREINDPWPWNASAHPSGFAKAWATKYAPWDHATRVVLWPNPLDSHQHEREGGFHPLLQVPQGNTSHQLMHFVSYVLGAAGEQRLPPGQLPVNTARRLQAALKTGDGAAKLEEDTPNADENTFQHEIQWHGWWVEHGCVDW